MWMVTKAVRLTRIPGRKQSVWAAILISGLLAGTTLGQGPIDVNETGLHDANSVYGIDGSAYIDPWTNSQSITVFAWGETDPDLYANVNFSAYGIYSSTATVTNSGQIDVTGTGGNANGIEGNAFASIYIYGLYGGGDVSNTGAIGVNATGGDATADNAAYALAQVYGIYANENANNTGNITINETGGDARSYGGAASAYVDVYGIFASMDAFNEGTLSITAMGGGANTDDPFGNANANVHAYGLYAYGNVTNAGNLTVHAIDGTAITASEGFYGGYASANATAYGIYSNGDTDNTGDLTVTATAGHAASMGSSAEAVAEAYGIYGAGAVSNEGNITVNTLGGTAEAGEGITDTSSTAYGISAWGNINNSGDITVTAETRDGTPSRAYGIYMESEPYGEFPDNEVTNTGTIRAFGDNAYELYVASGTTRIVNTYNVTLDGNPEVPSIFVADGATLDLNNATLTVGDVRGDVAGATQWDTEYQLFGTSNEAMVEGNFGNVQALNPDVTPTYYGHDTDIAADDTVALSFAPEAAETLVSASVEKRMVAQAPYAINRHMTMNLMYDMLVPDEESDADSTDEASLGQSACQRAGGAFLAPHYSYMEKDNDPLGYEAGLSGVSGGFTQCVNDSLLGLHLGYGQSNIDYTGAGYSANTEDVGIVTSGFSGLTRWKPWIVRYGFSGFHGWHDYKGLTGLGLTEQETASYNSYGGTGLVMIGRTFKRKQHVFLPEIGANWLWVHREGYTTEATDPAWDTTYSTLNDHDVWAQAALHWQSLYKYKKLQITPSASIGIHQLLTDGETEILQSIPSAAPVVVEDEQDETAVALAGAVVLRARRAALTLAYDGEYSSDIEQHNFWVKFKLRF